MRESVITDWTEVKGRVCFWGDKYAKVKWYYEGKEYAVRMDRELFDSLVHPQYSEVKEVKGA